MDPTYYILTVHVTDKWIDIQKRYLERFCTGLKVKTIAIVPEPGVGNFDEEFADQDPKQRLLWSDAHQRNLNFLTLKLLEQAQDHDVMIVLDGDAFPICPVRDIVGSLSEYRVVSIAIKGTDRSSLHVELKLSKYIACYFLAMKVGFWKSLNIDWGPSKFDDCCCDTNGKLIEVVHKKKIRWQPLRRSNKIEPCYPLFGVYGEALYHHGLGFHAIDSLSLEERRKIKCLYGIKPKEIKRKSELKLMTPKNRAKYSEIKMNWREGVRSYQEWKTRIWNLMFERIEKNPEFYKTLM